MRKHRLSPYIWPVICIGLSGMATLPVLAQDTVSRPAESKTAAAQHDNALAPADFQRSLTGRKVQLLDVRTAGEYQDGHLADALQADWTNKAQFQDRIASIDKDKPVYVYCLAGSRSAAAAAWMRQHGYDSVIELKGGINAWKNASLPVEGSPVASPITLLSYQEQTGKGLVLVDFGAEWCPPCRKMEPVIAELKKQKGKTLKVVNIDGGTQTALMQSLGVEAIPTFIIYKDGKELWRHQGTVTSDELKARLP